MITGYPRHFSVVSNVTNTPPSFVSSLRSSQIRDRFGGKLRASFSGGASLAPEVVDFVNALGIPVNNGYGLTETSPVCCSGFLGEPQKQVSGGCGVPLPGTRASIRSVADEKEVPDGTEGELWVAGPHIMQGYWNNKEATDDVIRVEVRSRSIRREEERSYEPRRRCAEKAQYSQCFGHFAPCAPRSLVAALLYSVHNISTANNLFLLLASLVARRSSPT